MPSPSSSQADTAQDNTMRPSIADKRARFRQLHTSGCFVIPNPWDVGSARWLQGLGFQALASTSSGMAWSQGAADNRISRAQALDHLRALVGATDVPVNADFENGFGADAAAVADSVRLAVATGVAGLSIEDSTGDAAAPLFAQPGAPLAPHPAPLSGASTADVAPASAETDGSTPMACVGAAALVGAGIAEAIAFFRI
jgi:hypothetical protein